jgi:DNA-binding transcriptional ArsR family regulator
MRNHKSGKGINVSKPLSGKALQMVADRFKALSDPMRLRLLEGLRSSEKTVSQLVEFAETTQANASKHLSVLADADMVGRRKVGNNVYYFVLDDSIFDLCQTVCRRVQSDLESKVAEFGG